MGGQGRGLRRSGVLLLLGLPVRFLDGIRVLLGLHLGRADQNMGAGVYDAGNQHDQQQDVCPAAPAFHHSFCHG